MQIHWYPGHMAKARRMLQENLKLIDVVAELLDARAPAATRNPDFEALFAGKARVVLLNKSDLADPDATRAWVEHFQAQGLTAGAVASTSNAGKKQAAALIERAAAPAVARMREKGGQQGGARARGGHSERGQIDVHQPHRRAGARAGGGQAGRHARQAVGAHHAASGADGYARPALAQARG